MKPIKRIIPTLVSLLLAITACKKEKVLQPQKQEITLADLSDWAPHAPFIKETEVTVSEEEYGKIQAAIGGVIVSLNIGSKVVRLPASITTGDHITTYYHKWVEKKLTIYMQKKKR